MKDLTRWGLAGIAAALLLMPARAEAQFINGSFWGGSNFQTGFDVQLFHDGGGLLRLVVTNIGDTNGDFAGIFEAIGLANVPEGVNVTGISADPTHWSFNTASSLSGDGIEQVVWAWFANAPAPQNGLDLNESATFMFQLDDWDDAWMSQIGVAVHSIGFEECSTKFGVWNGGADSNDAGPDGYDPDCVSVPEPGTNVLLAIGVLGLGLVAVRRRSLKELLAGR
ncbi:MAG: PEP-CTERM sorting domain-containing protein [Longimicrobiales bacterium]|nr:PEP-CTERM sorting domain-containing protein [Longimicrobiales bacterium]